MSGLPTVRVWVVTLTVLTVFGAILLLSCTMADQRRADIIRVVAPSGGRAESRLPVLRVQSEDGFHPSPRYFQLDDDSTFGSPIHSGLVEPDSTEVAWMVPEELEVGEKYYWRVGIKDNGSMQWDTVVSFLGGPRLHAVPNPFCCKAAKIHKKVTIDGMVPPVRLRMVSLQGQTVFESGEVDESRYVWPVTNQRGQRVDAGKYTIHVDDLLGSHTLELLVAW